MTFTEKMTEKARSMGKSLVLPESTEPRTLKAARIVIDEKIAKSVYLVGDRDSALQGRPRHRAVHDPRIKVDIAQRLGHERPNGALARGRWAIYGNGRSKL